jgi:rhodanese-related sulfurtransferase
LKLLGILGGVKAVPAQQRCTRLTPHSAATAMSDGAVLVDLRSEDQRRVDGDIPGAIVIKSDEVERRLAANAGVRWILISDGGRSSALAAASLRALGLVNATDVEGGFQEWWAAGLPVILRS